MKQALLLLVVLASVAHPAAAEVPFGRCALPGLSFFLMSTVNSLIATPGSISFTAANPDGGPVSGSTAATVNWSVAGGVSSQPWSISVQASGGSFVACTTVPASAVNVACVGASVTGNGTGACAGGFTLSTVAQQIAGGTQGDGTELYSVQVNYTLAESWRYVANPSCTLTLTYTVNSL